MTNKIYTAQEMREMAKNICRVDAMDGLTCRENCYTMKKAVLDMLRQAAEDKDAKDAEIEKLKKENACLRVINCGQYYSECNLREEILRLRALVGEMADEL